MNTLNFSGRGMSFLRHFMGKNDIRYYLNGICLRPLPGGGVLGAASNGHIVGLWYDKLGIIDAERVLSVTPALLTALGKGGNRLTELDGRLACVNDIGLEIHVQPNSNGKVRGWEIEGLFPSGSIAGVVSRAGDAKGGVTGGVDPAYLSVLNAAIKSRYPIVMRQANKDSAIYCAFTKQPEAFAVVMPVDGDGFEPPAWIGAASKEFKQAGKKAPAKKAQA